MAVEDVKSAVPSLAAGSTAAGLTVRTDRRGLPYVQMTVRVTGEAHIATLARWCERTGSTPARLASALVGDELRYVGMPRMRGLVRRTRAGRRAAYSPGGDRR